MTTAELVALRELEVAEQAISRAVMAREATRKHLEAVIRRESRRQRAKTSACHLRLIVGAARSTSAATEREIAQR
jgi:hypothetical protein